MKNMKILGIALAAVVVFSVAVALALIFSSQKDRTEPLSNDAQDVDDLSVKLNSAKKSEESDKKTETAAQEPETEPGSLLSDLERRFFGYETVSKNEEKTTVRLFEKQYDALKDLRDGEERQYLTVEEARFIVEHAEYLYENYDRIILSGNAEQITNAGTGETPTDKDTVIDTCRDDPEKQSGEKKVRGVFDVIVYELTLLDTYMRRVECDHVFGKSDDLMITSPEVKYFLPLDEGQCPTAYECCLRDVLYYYTLRTLPAATEGIAKTSYGKWNSEGNNNYIYYTYLLLDEQTGTVDLVVPGRKDSSTVTRLFPTDEAPIESVQAEPTNYVDLALYQDKGGFGYGGLPNKADKDASIPVYNGYDLSVNRKAAIAEFSSAGIGYITPAPYVTQLDGAMMLSVKYTDETRVTRFRTFSIEASGEEPVGLSLVTFFEKECAERITSLFATARNEDGIVCGGAMALCGNDVVETHSKIFNSQILAAEKEERKKILHLV